MRASTLSTASRRRAALCTQLAALGGLGGVERVAAQGIGERGHGAAAIDLGLGAFGLQLVEDACQLGDLAFVEVEPMGEEAQRPAHAEAAETFVETFHSRIAPGVVSGAMAPHAEIAADGGRVPGAVPGPLEGMHRHFSNSRGLCAPRRGFVGVGNVPHARFHRNAGGSGVKAHARFRPAPFPARVR